MRRTAVVCAWMIGVRGCWDREAAPSGDPLRLGQVKFDVPAGWHRTDANHPGAQVSLWVPDGEGNPRKESIAVIVASSTEDSLDEARLEKLLAGSQVALRGAKTSKVMPV